MEKIFSIVGYIIVSLGGGAIIVGGLSSWFGNIWAQRMLKKFDIESQNKLYSSQLQFEREYAIYSKLWKSLFLMKNSTLNLFPVLDYLPEDEDKKNELYSQRYRDCFNYVYSFAETLYSSSPFISSEIFSDLDDILTHSRQQLTRFRNYRIINKNEFITHDKLEECFDLNTLIEEKVNEVTISLKEYLEKFNL